MQRFKGPDNQQQTSSQQTGCRNESQQASQEQQSYSKATAKHKPHLIYFCLGSRCCSAVSIVFKSFSTCCSWESHLSLPSLALSTCCCKSLMLFTKSSLDLRYVPYTLSYICLLLAAVLVEGHCPLAAASPWCPLPHPVLTWTISHKAMYHLSSFNTVFEF